MPKRVSVKGKGADLFFGDYDPVESAAQPTAPASANGQSPEPLTGDAPGRGSTSRTRTSGPSDQAPAKGSRAKSASRRASRPASQPADEHASELASMLARC